MPLTLTDRQREVLTFLWDYLCEHGYQPSTREMMREIGATSPNGVVCHLYALQKKGWIEARLDGHGSSPRRATNAVPRARAIRLLYLPSGEKFIGLQAKYGLTSTGYDLPIGTWGGSENDR